jgi:hypothetical protein
LNLLDLNIDQPEFTVVEKVILRELKDKYEQYMRQGRHFEGSGVARSIQIMYKRLKGDFEDTQPTHWGAL